MSQYYPGGLLQAATAMPGAFHVAPGAPYFTNFINPMIPTNTEFFQNNVKSSNRGGHNNYKTRGRGHGRGGHGSNNDRNTPGGSSTTSQASYTPNYGQSYNPGQGSQQFTQNYGGNPGQYAKNNNGNSRNNHSNNWETSSQHSNSSQKKFSSSSGSSSVHDTAVSPPQPQVVQQRIAQVQPLSGYQPSQFTAPGQPHPRPQKEEYVGGGGSLPYQYHNTHARNMQETVQSKEFVSSNKRGRGGRGGHSSRGRDDSMGGYNSVPRGGGHVGAGVGGPPQRNQTHVYHGQQRHNSGTGLVQGTVPVGAGEAAAQQPPQPQPPKPDFHMKANDFPSLPGVADPAPAADHNRFLDVVKGTAKMKLEDDQETLPDDFIHDDVEESRNLGVEAISEPTAVSPSRDPRSKNSSVSEQTPVVSIERSGGGGLPMSPDAVSPAHDGLISPPLVNGETGGGKVTAVTKTNDRDSGSISPRQQSLVRREHLEVFHYNYYFSGCIWSETDLCSNHSKEEREGS